VAHTDVGARTTGTAEFDVAWFYSGTARRSLLSSVDSYNIESKVGWFTLVSLLES